MSMMTGVPQAANAPSFMGPVPPDRQEATLGEHLQAALQILGARPLDDQEMRDLKAFFLASDQIIRQKAGQMTGGQQPGQGDEEQGEPQGMDDETEEYGSGQGEPVTGNAEGAQPYGSI